MNQKNSLYKKIPGISKNIASNIFYHLDNCGVQYNDFGSRISMSCPIHDGDNKNACVVYYNQELDVPNWKCYSHHCEENFGKSLYHFFKQLYYKNNKNILDYIDVKNIKDSSVDFLVKFSSLLERKRKTNNKISLDDFKNKFNDYSSYFIDKGIKKEILDAYNVRFCKDHKNPMFNRMVVPVLDKNGKLIIGWLGRTVYNQCPLCDLYHSSTSICPENKKFNNYSKWKNSPGFDTNSYFYNWWIAKDYIKKTGKVFLVEGQADVWKMYEAGVYNVLGLFGNYISEQQKKNLEFTGAITISLFLDNDEGGEVGRTQIKKHLDRFYNIKEINYNKEPADCSIEEIKELCL